jgi:ATP-dependent RNA helicase RhlE
LNSPCFADLELIPPLQDALAKEGYTVPTPIQQQAIPYLLAGRDLLGCAQTGTGKTAAFALPILQTLDTNRRRALPGKPRVLVLSPTRELAAQINESFRVYGRFLRFKQTVVFGGVNQNPQVRALQRGTHVVVATPGRLLDLMQQGHLSLDELEMFVLDEADRMLDMGFLPDLKRIIAHLPKNRQSLFFSATMGKEVSQLAAGLLNDPVRVEIKPQTATTDLIQQRVLYVKQVDKRRLLQHLLSDTAVGQALVFTRTKRGADKIAQQLGKHGLKADAIHGDKSQGARNRVLSGFKSGRLQVLVATDVAARGIDVDGVTHVINYDMPLETENYVHRIGRTGRAGATGEAVSLCDPSERGMLRAVERLIKKSLRVDTAHPFHCDEAPVHLPPGKSFRSPGSNRSSGKRPPRKATTGKRLAGKRTGSKRLGAGAHHRKAVAGK